MDISTEIDKKNKIIIIKAACLLDQNIRKNILFTIALHIKDLGYHKVLVDLTESSFKKDEPMAGALELTSFMASIGIPQHAKIAFVFTEAEEHRMYFEGVAQTSGFNIRYFRHPDQARDWLSTP